jgi:hypothetical protein
MGLLFVERLEGAGVFRCRKCRVWTLRPRTPSSLGISTATPATPTSSTTCTYATPLYTSFSLPSWVPVVHVWPQLCPYSHGANVPALGIPVPIGLLGRPMWSVVVLAAGRASAVLLLQTDPHWNCSKTRNSVGIRLNWMAICSRWSNECYPLFYIKFF